MRIAVHAPAVSIVVTVLVEAAPAASAPPQQPKELPQLVSAVQLAPVPAQGEAQ